MDQQSRGQFCFLLRSFHDFRITKHHLFLAARFFEQRCVVRVLRCVVRVLIRVLSHFIIFVRDQGLELSFVPMIGFQSVIENFHPAYEQRNH